MTASLHTGRRTTTVSVDVAVRDLRGRLVVSDARALDAARVAVEAELAALDRIARPRGVARVVRHLLGDHPGLPERAPALWPFPYGVTVAPTGATAHNVTAADVRLDGRRRLDLGGGPTLQAQAAQRCAEAAATATHCGVMVSLGGDTATSGLAPAGGWLLQLPAVPGFPPTVLAIDGGAVSVLGVPAGGRLRRLRSGRAVWRHVVVLAATAPAASAAAAGAVLRGVAAPGWLAGHGLAARLVDGAGRRQQVGRWPG